MGLDMYAYTANRAQENWDNQREIAYWRKHPNLHGWMERLWESKGRPRPDTDSDRDAVFNGIELELSREDIDLLEQDILSGVVGKLDTRGFFFGDASDDYYRDHDLKFVRDARAELFCGLKVFYNSSW